METNGSRVILSRMVATSEAEKKSLGCAKALVCISSMAATKTTIPRRLRVTEFQYEEWFDAFIDKPPVLQTLIKNLPQNECNLIF
jgi:hypothetical protein